MKLSLVSVIFYFVLFGACSVSHALTTGATEYDCTLVGKHRPNHVRKLDGLLQLQSISPNRMINKSEKHVFDSYKKVGTTWVGQKGKLLEHLTFSGSKGVQTKLYVSASASRSKFQRVLDFPEGKYTLVATTNCQPRVNIQ
ncbi:MAG: hypothetical protein R2827_03680 [Bdellovibrionales bacterium]